MGSAGKSTFLLFQFGVECDGLLNSLDVALPSGPPLPLLPAMSGVVAAHSIPGVPVRLGTLLEDPGSGGDIDTRLSELFPPGLEPAVVPAGIDLHEPHVVAAVMVPIQRARVASALDPRDGPQERRVNLGPRRGPFQAPSRLVGERLRGAPWRQECQQARGAHDERGEDADVRMPRQHINQRVDTTGLDGRSNGGGARNGTLIGASVCVLATRGTTGESGVEEVGPSVSAS